jgi:hypothetical protein
MKPYTLPGWLETANRRAVTWSLGLPTPRMKQAALGLWTAVMRGALKLGLWGRI